MQQINNLSNHIIDNVTIIRSAITRVLESGWLVLGPEVDSFEKTFANYIGADYCVTVANGTDAIELSLKALGIQKGDTVATVANAGMYSTSAILELGASPYFMDVDLSSKLVTFTEVERAIKSGVKAVVVTHLFGLAALDIKRIANLCRKNNVMLLEDCAQAHGAKINGQCVGTFGDIASFSFYPTKNLGALGDGGAIITNCKNKTKLLYSLRQYGWKGKYKVSIKGGRNSRLDELQAAVLNEFIPLLDKWNSRRREIAIRYNDGITNSNIILPQIALDESYVGHLYVITSPFRKALIDFLKAEKIGTDIHYPIPDHHQPLFEGKFSSIALTNTEKLSDEVLTLPCYPEMSNNDIKIVISKLNKWTP
ncbi:DegT/DnrJ/EryC1/StrS family aminotransferase [Methylophilaceae bacterium]|nr:DegT/DnrJ/EryC1/StrS family aminotransferase [Methylophilaceae bacterium]